MIQLTNRELQERACQLRLLVFDVDGVLTEGELIYNSDGSESKRFHTHDGIGIMMARNAGIKVAIITGKDTPMVTRRAKELNLDEVVQGIFHKEEGIKQLSKKLKLDFNQIAYVGDDLHDIPALKVVGIPITVANARDEVKRHCVHVTEKRGGSGAARDLIEWILELRGEKETLEREFSRTEAENNIEAEASRDLAIHFGAGNNVVDLLSQSSTSTDLIIPERVGHIYNLQRLESLDAYNNPRFGSEAQGLLEKLNTLKNEDGMRYSSLIKFDGFEPWWFQQEQAVVVLQSYTRYRPLLERIAKAAEVTIYQCPDDLKNVLRIYIPNSTKLHFLESRSPVAQAVLSRFRSMALHMFRRTVSTVSLLWCMVRRPQVLVFSSDVITPGRSYDARIEKIYTSLFTTGSRFIEFFGSKGGGREIGNFFKRRRPCLYRDVAPVWLQTRNERGLARLGQSVGRSRQDPEVDFLHSVAEKILLPASLSSKQMVRNLQWILRRLRPQIGLFLDDSRYAHELVTACKLNGIPTLGVQHGLYSCIAPGLISLGFQNARNHGFDRYLMWSPFFVDLMSNVSSLYKKDNLRTGGLPRNRVSVSETLLPETDPSKERLRVMFVIEDYDSILQNTEVFPYVRSLLANPRIELFIKLRLSPVNVGKGKLRTPFTEMTEMDFPQPNLLTGPIDAYLPQMDVVVGSWSTAVLDSIYHQRPVVLFKTSLYEDPLGLSAAGVATIVDRPSELAGAVARAAQEPAAAMARYKSQVWGDREINAEELILEEILATI